MTVTPNSSRNGFLFGFVGITCFLAEASAAGGAGALSIPGVKTTYSILKEGPVDAPTVDINDRVEVHAKGTVKSTGKTFWNTRDKGETFTYTAGGGVIKGWDMGARGMKQGELRKLNIPFDEGYGSRGFPAWGIPPNGDLIFEIEVVSVKKKHEL
eukprot:TRINITY_DN75419_c0_g1_i1.p1 TRINITY_DN75419_c0_g1~~TRINITY_DN75419_c0_g1_i1.p1  ORF type:complete len:155 (-),score=19.65 TRINITY_DN75419_c0_g1_i1:120-584(-)